MERVQGVGGRPRHLGGHRPRRARRVHRLPPRRGSRFLDFVDAAAPGILVAQAMGRFGNYFNNEIHGAPTDLPWGLKVYEWDQAAGHAVLDANGNPVVLGVFHPTFLYEAIFCLLLAGLLIWLDRRHDFRRGQIFALYVAGYPVGRGVIEFMRTDDANHILGLRVNSWVSILVFLLGVFLYVWFGRRPATNRRAGARIRPGRTRETGRISTFGMRRPGI